MYRITFWNRKSTNFGKNSFVRLNGTESFNIQVEANALACIMGAVRNPDIQSATMDGPQGTLSWTKNPPRILDAVDECDYDSEEFECDDQDCDCNRGF